MMTEPNSHKYVSDWHDTSLWKLIEKDTSNLAKEVRHRLEECMPKIQNILSKGGTAATDFTLHDDGHAFRVAERMQEIIPPETLQGLSIYELAFLLLSAYLHDIGMTPPLRKVTSHYHFLMSGETNSLSPEEIRIFQHWLDDDGRQITPRSQTQYLPAGTSVLAKNSLPITLAPVTTTGGPNGLNRT